MTTEHVLEWVKTLINADHFYCGTPNAKKDRSVGVYRMKEGRARDIALGGRGNTKTGTKGISILVHWNRSIRETEAAATRLYDKIAEGNEVRIGDLNVNYIELLHNEPIDVGTDENGICECVIELVIHYERK